MKKIGLCGSSGSGKGYVAKKFLKYEKYTEWTKNKTKQIEKLIMYNIFDILFLNSNITPTIKKVQPNVKRFGARAYIL